MSLDTIKREYLIKEELDIDLPEGSIIISEVIKNDKIEMSVFKVTNGELKSPNMVILRVESSKNTKTHITFVNITTNEVKQSKFNDFIPLSIKINSIIAISSGDVKLEKIPDYDIRSILQGGNKSAPTS